MTINKKHECIREYNRGIKCEYSNCNICRYNPKKVTKRRQYYASGMTLIEGRWQSCGWNIEANSFVEAAQIAEADEKFKIYSLRDCVMY